MQALEQGTRVDLLLEVADDELILGWRNSEWTGIAPLLEEDVAFSSIAQNEIGHARALYELAAAELGTTADALALDRPPHEYRAAPLVQLRLPEWESTLARHFFYETADELRLGVLKSVDEPDLRGLAEKIDREEAYHRMHMVAWVERLLGDSDGRPRFRRALEELWPYALGVLDATWRPRFVEQVHARLEFELPEAAPVARGAHTDDWRELWEEMTMVRRSEPAGTAW